MKKSEFGKIINSLTEIATQEVKSTGVCTIPGVCRQNQMVNKTSIEGKEEESVWQSGDCQSKANKKSGEGLSCLCFGEGED